MSVSLQLEKYFFTRFSVEAHPPPVDQKGLTASGHAASTIELSLSEPQDKDTQYQLTLIVEVEPNKEGNHIPYTAQVEVVGLFTIPATENQDIDLNKLVKITGGSILYSAIREQILSMTARGPFPPMQLPTINLVKVVENGAEG